MGRTESKRAESEKKRQVIDIHFENKGIDERSIDAIVKWYNDEEIAPFIHPNFQAAKQPPYTKDDVRHSWKETPDKFNYLIFDTAQVIGELSIQRNFFMLHDNVPNTAWISICIGEKEYWGQGVAQTAMRYLETECVRLGFERIELGVFEHNARAYRLYQKMGYREIARYPDFTYSQGKWHADIRMEKALTTQKEDPRATQE
jgi:RimJ/RimL family protein N-acetyltransferase